MVQGRWVFARQAPGTDQNTQHQVNSWVSMAVSACGQHGAFPRACSTARSAGTVPFPKSDREKDTQCSVLASEYAYLPPINKNFESSQRVHEEQLGTGLGYTWMAECLPITDKTLGPITGTEKKPETKTRRKEKLFNLIKITYKNSWAQWCALLMPAQKRQRQTDLSSVSPAWST